MMNMPEGSVDEVRLKKFWRWQPKTLLTLKYLFQAAKSKSVMSAAVMVSGNKPATSNFQSSAGMASLLTHGAD